MGQELGRLVLSHHAQHELERCIVVNGRHVCRRCSVLYPLAFVVMTLVLTKVGGLHASLPLMILLPVPVTIEFLAEQLGALRYDARRQVVVTALAAPALGMGLARVLTNRADHGFWLMVAVHAVPCAVIWALTNRRENAAAERERVAVEERHPVLQGFDSAEEFRAYLDQSAERLGINR